MSKTAQPITDTTLRQNLRDILVEFGAKLSEPVSVEVNTPRQALIDDLSALIRRLPMSSVQRKQLYDAVVSKMISRICSICLKLKPVDDGTHRRPGGDLSKPPVFICGDCK